MVIDGNLDPSWQTKGSDYLSHVPLAAMLEGSPRGHPWNINVCYIRGSMNMIDSVQTEANSGKLDETFNNLQTAEPLQVLTRQTTADACAVLHGVQVVTVEVKSLSDKNNVGFHQQALLMADFFARRDPQHAPPGHRSPHQCLQDPSPNASTQRENGWRVRDHDVTQGLLHRGVSTSSENR